MLQFSYFLGIDQTGAACAKGKRAKPLKVCLANKTEKGWEINTQNPRGQSLTIDGVTPAAIQKLLNQFEIDRPNSRLAIMADCVLGMPKDHWPSLKASNPSSKLWKLFQKAHDHSHEGANFGLKVSESFFKQFLKDPNSFSKRYCEEISGSNSIFTTRPFQKNIQTGTFRIWRDLVSEGRAPWLNIWPFNSKSCYNPENPWLFEGYPTLFWRNYLEIPNRNGDALIKKLKTLHFKNQFSFDTFAKIQSDPDLCDAAVLVLGGILLQNTNSLMTPFSGFWETPIISTEGWISGQKKVSVVFPHRQK